MKLKLLSACCEEICFHSLFKSFNQDINNSQFINEAIKLILFENEMKIIF